MLQANAKSVLRGKATVRSYDCTALVEGHTKPCYLFYELVFANSFSIEENQRSYQCRRHDSDMVLEDIDDFMSKFIVEDNSVFFVFEGVKRRLDLLSVSNRLSKLYWLVKVQKDRTEVHSKNLNSFDNSRKAFFDFVLASQFIRERLSFKRSGVIDSDWYQSYILYFFIEETISQNLQNTKLRCKHFVCAAASSLNEKFHNDLVAD